MTKLWCMTKNAEEKQDKWRVAKMILEKFNEQIRIYFGGRKLVLGDIINENKNWSDEYV